MKSSQSRMNWTRHKSATFLTLKSKQEGVANVKSQSKSAKDAKVNLADRDARYDPDNPNEENDALTK